MKKLEVFTLQRWIQKKGKSEWKTELTFGKDEKFEIKRVKEMIRKYPKGVFRLLNDNFEVIALKTGKDKSLNFKKGIQITKEEIEEPKITSSELNSIRKTKTPEGWHKFTDKEIEPDRSFGGDTSLKVIGSWVNYKTEDMVNVLKCNEKKPYLVHTSIIGQLAKVGDKFFSNVINAKDYAIGLMKSVTPKSKKLKKLAEKTLNEKSKQIKDAVEMYKEAKKNLKHGYLHLKNKLGEKRDYPKEVIELSKNAGYDLNNIDSSDLLTDSELFEIDEKTKWILQLTNNEIFIRNMPYNKVCLDCDLIIDKLWFKGFIITSKGLTFTYWGNREGFCNNPLIFDAFQPNDTNLEKHFQKELKLKKSVIKKLKLFICNFFDFLNNPEVRLIRIHRSKKNTERRIRQGKEPLPSSNKIRITGTLKSYLEKPEFSGEHFNFRFWVRGHFMRFWNKKRFAKLYEQSEQGNLPTEYYVDDKIRHHTKILMKWKKPFIKGRGVLISKRYEVRK